MCLQLKDFNCRVTEKDITVYKVLVLSKNELVSPYQQMPYELNKLYEQKFSFNMAFHALEKPERIEELSKLYLNDDRFDLTNCRYCPGQQKTSLNVLNGLHSHGSVQAAMECRRYLLTYAMDANLFEAVIPKGSTIFGGNAIYDWEENQYVSNQLIILKDYYS